MMGAAESAVVSGSVRSAREHGLPHELLDAAEIHRRYPVFHPPPDAVALFEEKAGFLRPEEGVRAHLDRAASLGALLHFGESVKEWSADENGVRVITDRGSYEAGRLVIAPGAWAPRMLAGLGLPLEVERQVLYWFEPKAGVGAFRNIPIYIWEAPAGMPYGFPAIDGLGGGTKVAFFRAPVSCRCTPETVDREVREDEIAAMRDSIAELIPSLAGSRCVAAATCFYTNTPDQNFIIANHPDHPNVAIACGFSGHGYKFCSVVGEILADLSIDGVTRHPIELFSPRRATLK
jgi:sarcosine oxidase